RALTFGRRSHPSARGGATSASLLRSFPVAVRICPLDGLELPTLRSFPVAMRICPLDGLELPTLRSFPVAMRIISMEMLIGGVSSVGA
ncbi:hypothetical protein, partial [uncultured Duncaniella sp.]|uniref:hypothetical protein n=1 Tax=uncultured Duncaniella sp. TaxID=2768039 RepID=UPI002647CC93